MASAPKKAKADANLLDVFTEGFLSPESREKYREQYVTNGPYPHCVFQEICKKEVIEGVRDEIVGTLETTFKETDLFKLYQTTDLANIDQTQPELAAKLPTLIKLREALYSEECRSFVSYVTGCGELTTRVDMAASAYTSGSHLLCHDDVIGTRAVSFILYFSAEDWSEKDGGALELYPLQEDSIVHREAEGQETKEMLVQGLPQAKPTTRHLPLFNCMGAFRVMPGRSYHSVQEVLRDGSPRLSIQGWFHNAVAPKGVEMASLNQLKASASLSPFTSLPQPATCLSEDSASTLSAFVNDLYLKPESISAIAKQFEENSSVQLRDFLKPELAAALTSAHRAVDKAQGLHEFVMPKDDVGESAAWALQAPPHMQRYLKCTGADATPNSIASIMHQLKTELFESPAFSQLLSAYTTGQITGYRTEARRFRPGLDYTVAHHGLLEQVHRLDATLCFVDDDDDLDASAWQSGDIGGFECYIAADDEDTVAAEVYCDDDAAGNDLLSVQASNNTLNIVLRDVGTMRFVKFVSANAPGSRLDVCGVFEVEFEDDDEEDAGEQGDDASAGVEKEEVGDAASA
eukprot:m.23237 g.23237  ORF g.23237 m.23237 type:complete len:575 (+) comp8466_c1_seq1:224-1948(+)